MMGNTAEVGGDVLKLGYHERDGNLLKAGIIQIKKIAKNGR